MTRHILKTLPICWDAIQSGEKRFEARKDDRFYQRGDTVVLRRFDPKEGYTTAPGGGMFSTRDLTFTIGWMLRGEEFGIKPGYVVFQLETVPVSQEQPA